MITTLQTNHIRLAAALNARAAAGHPSALQWWHNASPEQRQIMARYCPQFRPLLVKGGKRG